MVDLRLLGIIIMEDLVQEEYLSTVKVLSHRQLCEENAPLFRVILQKMKVKYSYLNLNLYHIAELLQHSKTERHQHTLQLWIVKRFKIKCGTIDTVSETRWFGSIIEHMT